MNTPLLFVVPLTKIAHNFAKDTCRSVRDSVKAEELYLNRLAVFAVNYYLEFFAIETDLGRQKERNFVLSLLSNTARLHLPNIGDLECRPVPSEAETCIVPFEVREDALGYVAVRVNAKQTQAQLLGFFSPEQLTRFPQTEAIPLDLFRPLETIFEHLQPREATIRLSDWLNNAIDASWQTVEQFLQAQQPAFATRFRGQYATRKRKVEASDRGVKRWKLVDLERAGEQVALFIGLEPKDRKEMKVEVEVYPNAGNTHLPQDLQLMILDEGGEAVMQAKARQTKNLQFDFSGDIGENFGVKLMIGDVSFMQSFVI